MNKLNEITPIFIDEIPESLEEGKLYISEMYGTAIHLCACGCLKKTVTPFAEGNWSIFVDKVSNTVSLKPSIGNFSGENPYHAHYFITDNKIEWC